MNYKKGILRVVVLLIWFLCCAAFTFEVFQALGSIFVFYRIIFCAVIFEYGFYLIPVTFLLCADSLNLRGTTESLFDIKDLSSKIIYVISIITGLVALAVYSSIEPTSPDIRTYLFVFVVPFMFVFGSCVYVLWIMEGLRDR